jgi:hypothetical protein
VILEVRIDKLDVVFKGLPGALAPSNATTISTRVLDAEHCRLRA